MKKECQTLFFNSVNFELFSCCNGTKVTEVYCIESVPLPQHFMIACVLMLFDFATNFCSELSYVVWDQNQVLLHTVHCTVYILSLPHCSAKNKTPRYPYFISHVAVIVMPVAGCGNTSHFPASSIFYICMPPGQETKTHLKLPNKFHFFCYFFP